MMRLVLIGVIVSIVEFSCEFPIVTEYVQTQKKLKIFYKETYLCKYNNNVQKLTNLRNFVLNSINEIQYLTFADAASIRKATNIKVIFLKEKSRFGDTLNVISLWALLFQWWNDPYTWQICLSNPDHCNITCSKESYIVRITRRHNE